MGRRGPCQAITFAFLQIAGICFVRVHSLSMSRSQDLALLPICCSIYVSTSSNPAAFPGFSRPRPVASSSRLKGLVSSVGGWLLLGTIVSWCSPGGLRCSTLLPLDTSWLAIWSVVTSRDEKSRDAETSRDDKSRDAETSRDENSRDERDAETRKPRRADEPRRARCRDEQAETSR